MFLLLALRQAFPNADKELKRFGAKYDSKSINNLFKTGNNSRCHRIELAEYNLRRSGVSLETPTYDYPDGKYPECIFMTRESFELALRNLVTKHLSRLRWVTGTVTGLKAHEGGQHHANPFDMFQNFFGGGGVYITTLRYISPNVTFEGFQHQEQVRKGPTSITEFEVSLADMYTGQSIDVRHVSHLT